MGESRKNPFPGRRGVGHLLRSKMEKAPKKQTPSQITYKRLKNAGGVPKNTQARIKSVTPQAADMGAKVPGSN